MQIKSISLSSCDQTMEGGSGSWWEKMINFTTISGDVAVMNESGTQYNSFCAYKSLFKLSDSSGELYTTNLNHGEVYNINQSSLFLCNFIFHSLNIICF
jgi:hypothetical protein